MPQPFMGMAPDIREILGPEAGAATRVDAYKLEERDCDTGKGG